MTDPQVPDAPVYDDTAAELGDDPLADCPPAGSIDLEREPGLFDDLASPTPDDDEEADDAS